MKDNKFLISVFGLFWLPVILPLTAILVSFIFGVWSWGLMDDGRFVTASGSMWQRFTQMSFAFGGAGRLQPVLAAYVAVFYRIFEHHPQAFYLFRWLEVVLTLGVWGWLVARLTKRWWAALLFISLTLSFERFYDAFFFLSLQEILGVFFVGLALLLYFSCDGRGPKTTAMTWLKRMAIVISFSLAVLSKETFVVCPMALGLASIIFALGAKLDRSRLVQGAVLFCVSLGFAIYLKAFVARGYSADYVINDFPRMAGNLWQWLCQVFPYHIPGLIICVVALWRKNLEHLPHRRLALVLGALFYILYLMIVLPWSAAGHYVLPLGVFAAFLMTVFSAPRLDTFRPRLIVGVVLLLSVLTVGVGAKALYYHQTYQYDTANLLEWMRDNALFRHELDTGANVRANAAEPSDTIPAAANYLYATTFASFQFTSNVREIISDPQTRYFLWGPFWGNQDLRRLKDKLLWYPVFTSKHWIMFRRAY